MLRVRQAIILLVGGLCFCTWKAECTGNFTQCYSTAREMHCFSKIVDGTVNFTEAQRRCKEIDATLLIVKDDEVQTRLESFISYLKRSAGIEDSISYFWTNANRIVEPKWKWLNSSVINELDPYVTSGLSFDTHVASLSPQNGDQQKVSLTANYPGEIMNYICESFAEDCQLQNGNVLQAGDKCYVASKDNGSWYDARNKCLMQRGDLASFGNLQTTNINFTQWLDLSAGKQYWVGARILWWSWKDSDNSEVRYTNWFRRYPVTVYSSDDCVSVYGDSGLASQINGWKTENCNQDTSVGVICHKVTSLDPTTRTTTSASFGPTKEPTKGPTVELFGSSTDSTVLGPTKGPSMTLFGSSTDSTVLSCSGCANTLDALKSSTTSRVIALGLGIGLGVGIPVVIALIVIIIVCVRRKRKHPSSGSVLKGNSNDCELKDIQIDSLKTGKDNFETVVTDKDNVETGEIERDNVQKEENDEDNVVTEETYRENADTEETDMDDVEPEETHNNNVETEETDQDNVHTEETREDNVETEVTDQNNFETEEKYWEVAKNDSAVSDEGQVADFTDSNAISGDGIVYAAVEFADQQGEDDLP